MEHDSYGPPSYTPPVITYEHPDPPSYHPEPVYHHVSHEPERPNFDFTFIIVACLFLFGLSLIFPVNVRIDDVMTGRKKRYAEEIARSDFSGRSMEIYDHLNMALEPIDRGCMEKITCEVGSLSYDAGFTSNPILK